MIIAIDKTNYKLVKMSKRNEYIYVFENETYEDYTLHFECEEHLEQMMWKNN